MSARSLILAVLALAAATALAVPTWDAFAAGSFNQRADATTLVPGATVIEAIGTAQHDPSPHPLYLAVAARYGAPGNAIVHASPLATLFFLSPRDGQLFQVVNRTTVQHVNVLATHDPKRPDASPLTPPADFHSSSPLRLAPETPLPPLRLAMDYHRTGQNTGRWRWQGSMLYYDQGDQHTTGIFYKCVARDGSSGVFLFLKPAPTPEGCEMVTLHSFSETPKGGRGH